MAGSTEGDAECGECVFVCWGGGGVGGGGGREEVEGDGIIGQGCLVDGLQFLVSWVEPEFYEDIGCISVG